jgi:hypothetical protein
VRFIAITLEGRSLRLVPLPDGGIDLRADDETPGPRSVFERLDLSHGRIALRVPDGRYLARHMEHAGKPTDMGAVVHLVDEVSQCAAFEEVHVPGGYVSLRGCDLRFLGVHTSGRVVADRISNGTWERFRYLEIPAPLVTAVPGGPAPLRTAAPAEPAPLRAALTAQSDASQPRSGLGGWGLPARSAHRAGLAVV